jgi:hypothetical protein
MPLDRMALGVIAAALVFHAHTVVGQSLKDIAGCADIESDSGRLACYDRYNPPRKTTAHSSSSTSPVMPAPPVIPPVTAPVTPPVAKAEPPAGVAAAPTSSAEFGLSDKAKREKEAAENKPAPPKEVAARVTEVSTPRVGDLLVILDNGQRWMGIERKPSTIVRSGDTVRIRAGALGGYMLITPAGTTIRVKRLD